MILNMGILLGKAKKERYGVLMVSLFLQPLFLRYSKPVMRHNLPAFYMLQFIQKLSYPLQMTAAIIHFWYDWTSCKKY